MPKSCYEKLVYNLILGVCCDFRRVLTSWRLEIRTEKIEFTIRGVLDTRHKIRQNTAQEKFLYEDTVTI